MFLAAAVAPLLCALVPVQEAVADTRSVAKSYIEANFRDRDLDRSLALLDEQAFFVDPTGEPFGGPLAKGVRGREAIGALQRSWRLTESSYKVDVDFVAGEYAVHAGKLSFSGADGSSFKDVPFATIFRVREGKLVERHDYGDYTKLVGAKSTASEVEELARAYLDAYLGRRFGELEELSAEDVCFQDPTAVLIGGGKTIEGRKQVRANFERSFQTSLSFELDEDFSFFFHRQAVFAGTCRFAFPGSSLGLPVEKATFEIPLLIVLEVRDGLVVRHLDYAGYDAYRKQFEAFRTKTR